MDTLKEFLLGRYRNFFFALKGFSYMFRTQLNFRIEVIITVLVFVAGLIFEINLTEWVVIAVTVFLVVISEAINTAIEETCNAITKEYNYHIKLAKDAAAGGVLLAVINSVVVGVIVFLPKVLELF